MIPSIKAAILICTHAFALLVRASPVAFSLGSLSANSTLLSPRLLGQFRIRDCSDANQAVIENALQEVQMIAAEAYTRTSALGDLLSNQYQVETSGWSDLDASTFDMFESIFGPLLLPSDNGVISDDSIDTVASVTATAKALSDALVNYQSLNLDIFCNDNYLIQPDPKGQYSLKNGEIYFDDFWDTSGNEFGWVDVSKAGRCATNPSLAGACENNAKIQNVEPVSIITLCPAIFDDATTTLTQSVATTYTTDEVALEVLLRSTISFYLLHELGHATAITPDPLDDKKFPDPDNPTTLVTAYGWVGVLELSNNADVAIDNADSFAFYACAMYLKSNTWWTGTSQPLSYTARSVYAANP